MVNDLMDKRAPWWLKYAHARKHADALRDAVDRYLGSSPFDVVPESTGVGDEMAYRLRVRDRVPDAIPLMLGDTVHNLRSALDNLMFDLVERALGRPYTDDEEWRVEFPIRDDPATFEAFFDRRRFIPQVVRDTVRVGQPWYWDEVVAQEIEATIPVAQRRAYYPLHQLARISNIDKHRYVAVTGWFPALASWGTQGETNRSWRPGDGRFEDGAIVGYVTGHDEGGSAVQHDIDIIITDLLPSHNDVSRLVEAWQRGVYVALMTVIQEWNRRLDATAE